MSDEELAVSYDLKFNYWDSDASAWTKKILRISLQDLWDLIDMIQKVNDPEQLLNFAMFISTVLHINQAPRPLELQLAERNYLGQILKDLSSIYTQHWEDIEERVLAFTYYFLRKGISRKEVAQFATKILGKEYQTEAWRKKVDRWAERQKLPQPGRPRSRQ